MFDSGFVACSVEAKNPNWALTRKSSLTSEEVASEMTLGVLERSAVNIALANTAMASADGELDGVMCFACALESARAY